MSLMFGLRKTIFFGRYRNTSPRVGFLMQYFQPGGLEKIVVALAKGIQQHGMEPRVAAYLEGGPVADELKQAGIPAKLIKVGSGLQTRLPLLLARWMMREKIDLCHTHHLGPYMYAAPACKALGVPMVHTEHSREFYDRSRRKILGWSMNQFARVVVVSPELARFREKQLHGRAEVIENGVSIPQPVGTEQRSAARKLLSLPVRGFVIGCVARLAPEKDHATLLEAFSRFADEKPSASLVIVGGGPSEQQIASKIEQSRHKKRIHLLGYRTDMDAILPAFDLVALASLREGLPLALLEAMAHGLAIVATRVGAIPELIENGGGLTVPVADPPAMAKAFTQLATDSALRKKHGAIARQLVIDRYALDTMVDAYATLYRSILASGKTQ